MAYNWSDDIEYLRILIREIIIDIHDADPQKSTTFDQLFAEILKYHPDCKKEQVQSALQSMSRDQYYKAVLAKISGPLGVSK